MKVWLLALSLLVAQLAGAALADEAVSKTQLQETQAKIDAVKEENAGLAERVRQLEAQTSEKSASAEALEGQLESIQAGQASDVKPQ